MKNGEIKTVRVTFEEFCSYDFIPKGRFYVRDATGDYMFIKTSDRIAAQAWIDEEYGKGKYRAVPAQAENLTSKQESGGYSCTGTSTRRGQKR